MPATRTALRELVGILARAQRLLDDGDLDGAWNATDEAIAIDPHNVQAADVRHRITVRRRQQSQPAPVRPQRRTGRQTRASILERHEQTTRSPALQAPPARARASTMGTQEGWSAFEARVRERRIARGVADAESALARHDHAAAADVLAELDTLAPDDPRVDRLRALVLPGSAAAVPAPEPPLRAAEDEVPHAAEVPEPPPVPPATSVPPEDLPQPDPDLPRQDVEERAWPVFAAPMEAAVADEPALATEPRSDEPLDVLAREPLRERPVDVLAGPSNDRAAERVVRPQAEDRPDPVRPRRSRAATFAAGAAIACALLASAIAGVWMAVPREEDPAAPSNGAPASIAQSNERSAVATGSTGDDVAAPEQSVTTGGDATLQAMPRAETVVPEAAPPTEADASRQTPPGPTADTDVPLEPNAAPARPPREIGGPATTESASQRTEAAATPPLAVEPARPPLPDAVPPSAPPPATTARTMPPSTGTAPALPTPTPPPAPVETQASANGSGGAAASNDRGAQDEVLSVLEGYRRAYNTLDAGAARAVWPAVNAPALARAFGQLQSQSVRFTACDVVPRDERAVAVCAGQAAWVPRVGDRSRRSEDRTWRFTLARRDDSWVIESVDVQR